MEQGFFYAAAGVAVLLVALGLLFVFRRLNRALRAMEEVLLTANEELRETLPEVRGSVGNVNDITAAVNLGVHAAEEGVGRSGRNLRSAAHGLQVGLRSFITGPRGPVHDAGRTGAGATPANTVADRNEGVADGH